jgi:hypothetical protein
MLRGRQREDDPESADPRTEARNRAGIGRRGRSKARRASCCFTQCFAVPAEGVHATALRYKCQVACPNTGATIASPRKNGIIATTSTPATINPQSVIESGFLAITRKEVRTASVADARRSMIVGKETTLVENATIANPDPAAHHSRRNVRPSVVPTRCLKNPGILARNQRTHYRWTEQ